MTRKTKVARARPPPSRNRTLSSPTILLAIVVLSIGLVYVFQPDLLPSSLWLARKPTRGTTKFDGHNAENVLAGQGGSAPSFDKAAGSLAYKSIWSDAPPVSKDALRTRVVAVGDLHGDIGNARKVLNMAGVVDEEGKWTGDVDVFVQTGDIIDRGDDTIKLFFWMEELRAQAELAGGRVLSHLGNHEWMNAIGDWRYVPQTEIKTFGSVAARQKMLSTGRIGRAWATNYSTTSRVPLHDALGLPNEEYPPPPSAARLPAPLSHAAYSFVHGGLSPTYAHLTPFPSAINALGESLLSKLYARGPVSPHPPAAYPGLPVDATQDEIELYDTNGPLWYRGWALSPEEDVCGVVDAVLEKTGTRRMVMGHTPDFSKIVSRCGGKILVIDTGISHAYGGVLAALAVEYSLERGSDRGWTEHEVVRAVYESGPVVLVDETRTIPTWDPSL